MEVQIASLLAQVSRLMRRAFDEKARTIGVTRPQWQVLSVLRHNAGIKQGGLAEILEVEPITAGRMIDRMQEAGLVERRPDPADRRAWRLHLTQRGDDLVEQLRPLAREAYELALDGVTEEDRVRLLGILEGMRANITRNPSPEA